MKTPSQRIHAHTSIQQKPDAALQTYNSRYKSHFRLAYPDITVDDAGSRTQCIHYASSLHSKLGDRIEGRLNQDLPGSLEAAFNKATNDDDQPGWSMDSNPIHNPSPAKKMKCSFLDYIQLLMISQAGQWTQTPSAIPSPAKKMKCPFFDYVQLLMIGQAGRWT